MVYLLVEEYLSNKKVTHIEDFEFLLENVIKDVTLKFYAQGESNFCLDFTGYTISDIDAFEERLEELKVHGITVKTDNVHATTLNTDLKSAYHILYKLEYEKNLNTPKEIQEELEALIQTVLKNEPNCNLDFSNTTSSALTGKRSPGALFQVLEISTLMILAELKAKYGEKLNYTGLHPDNDHSLNYLFNYFTLPHCMSEEEVAEHMKREYKVGDFIIVNNMQLSMTPETLAGTKKVVTLSTVMRYATVNIANLKLGYVVNIGDEYIEYLVITPSVTSTLAELKLDEYSNASSKSGRYTYERSDTAIKSYYRDLLYCHETIHGVEMISEYELLYDIISNLKPNPPRVRQLYFSPERRDMYIENLKKYLPSQTSKVKYKTAPTVEQIRSETTPKKSFYDIGDIV